MVSILKSISIASKFTPLVMFFVYGIISILSAFLFTYFEISLAIPSHTILMP